ncbi:MAG TPA: hypothetical protein VK200_04560 [Candidatus Limnocylindrales bacterium]|nr:hypothetical protein [Candidatus Limnocylindrales bacterium]
MGQADWPLTFCIGNRILLSDAFDNGTNMDNPAAQFVDEEWPNKYRPLIPAALRRAYLLADEAIDRIAFLRTVGGRYQRGDLIMLAASFEFEQLLASGSLPFDGSWEYFARPTGQHFVIRTPRARITTSQVEDPRKKPRAAIFRANYAELNEKSLFPEVNEQRRLPREEIERDNERRLIHILHGYQTLDFAHLVYPHPESNRHIFRSLNLLNLPRDIDDTDPSLPPPEGPSDSPDPEALERIERHLRDHSDD